VSLLLDTHVVLWWLIDDPTLSDDLKDAIDQEPDVHLSAATVWEVAIKQAIKQAIGKLQGPDDLIERMRASGLRELAITSEHAMLAGRLPRLHRDPFDRVLVAQARWEDLTVVTRDARISAYGVPVLAA
jgi:PIN domain nuclease of toxin-antitoxin system